MRHLAAKLATIGFIIFQSAIVLGQEMHWPIHVPRITQDYGCLNCVVGHEGFHSGIDLTDALESCSGEGQVPVFPALGGGRVVRTFKGCTTDKTCGRFFGNHVLIEHRGPTDPAGPLYSLYAHLRSVAVNVNDMPSLATPLGIMGNTGDITACHLHFGILNYKPPNLGAYDLDHDLPSAGFIGYPGPPQYPSSNCDETGAGHGCLDPKEFFGFFPIEVSVGSRDVLEGPGLSGKCVTRVEADQTYVRLASTVQQGQEWQYVMLPSDLGPEIDPEGNQTCTTDAIYGWLAEDTALLPFGFGITVMGQALDGIGLRVRQEPSTTSPELTKVWGGQTFWATTTAAGSGCSNSWYQISVPPSRANGAANGWVCGDFVVPHGGQCTSSSSGSFAAESSCGPPPQAPTVATNAATDVTQGSATLNLSVNPNGRNTTIWFEWGATSGLGQETLPHQSVGAGSTTIPASVTLGGLTCDKTYYFRARAQNSIDSALPGETRSFKTGPCGGGGSDTQELVTNGGFESGNTGWIASGSFYIDNQPCPYSGSRYAFLAHADGTRGDGLSGTLDQVISIPANATGVTYSYRYSISTNDPSSQPQDVMTVWVYNSSGSSALKLLESYSNLDAQNGCGSSFYDRETFDLSQYRGQTIRLRFLGTTDFRSGTPTVFRLDAVSVQAAIPQSSAPEVTTENADRVTSSSARLNMTVDPNGADTEIWFDLEPGDSTPSDDTEHINIGAGSGNRTASISVFDLECGTRYYFRAHAENTHDRANGDVEDFTTSACSGGAPHADTDPAENITQTSATLTADVDPNGLPTQAWFAWGESPNLDQETPHASVGSGTGNVDFSQMLAGLACGTTYYFENHAQNSADHDDGVTLEFTTLPCDGGGSPAQGFFLENRRQGCSSDRPAILLWWTAPAGMGNVFTVRRTDGGYTATVDASQGGRVHLISNSLVPGETYSFYVEGTLNGTSMKTNAVTVPVISDECRLPVGAGELPHLPLAWAGTPFCSGGTASVPVQWTAVGGADSYTLTRIDNVAAELTPYPNLAGTNMIDTGLVPGAAYEYMLDAVGSGGSRRTNSFTVYVPSGICSEPSTPGPFSAQVSAPVCNAGKGAVTLSWTLAQGAESGTHTYRADDGFTHGSGTTYSGSSKFVDGIRPGALLKLMVQAESATTPRQYRSIIMAQRIPLDICGSGTLPPAVTTTTAPYIQEHQALLRASIVPNADSSTAFFEWGTTTSYGSTTPQRNAGDGYRSVSLGEVLTGLACGTTYHFRAVAVNANGRIDGIDQSFTTSPCDQAQCFVNVVSPAGGETWVKGTPHTIRWNAGSGCVSFAVKLRRAGLHDGSININIGAATDEIAWIPEPWRLPGANLQIEVRGFNSEGNGSSALSDSFSIVNPPVLPALIFEDTMESGTSNWSYAGWGITNYTAHSPTHSRTASVYGNNAVNESLISPRIDISGRRAVVLTFWRYCDVDDSDIMNVWASTDQGATWTYLRGFVGRQTEWQPVTIDLKNFLGQPSIQISFQLLSDGSLTADGCYIDDIKIYEPPSTDFYTVTPCRLVDTRQGQTPLLPGESPRTLAVAGACGIPPSARAVSLNVTAVNPTGGGFIKLFPADQTAPPTSTLNFAAGQVRANNAILGLSEDGRLAAVSGGGQVDLLLDVNGYFAQTDSSTVTRYLTQNVPGQTGKDIWTTSVYSYAPAGGGPGGGLDDHRLRVGGWGDLYYSLLEFDLNGLPQHAQSARIELFAIPHEGAAGTTALYLDRITELWDWRIQGTGSDRWRLWWADRPDAVQWRPGTLPAPTPGQWYSIDITDLYNAWRAGTYPNYGVQLRPVSTNNMWAEFYSANYADPALRPRLVIEP